MWGKVLSLVLVTAALVLSTAARADEPLKGVVVMIPGTFNSLAPGYLRRSSVGGLWEANPYFSIDAVSSVESRGYKAYVVRDLVPFGQFEANGARALREIEAWYDAKFPNHDVPITLLGHSAGGFYGLYVAEH